jgi:HD-like signal output (HDOD) protein
MAEQKPRDGWDDPEPRRDRLRQPDKDCLENYEGHPLPFGDDEAEDGKLEITFKVVERLFKVLMRGLISPAADEIKSILRLLHAKAELGPVKITVGHDPEAIVAAALKAGEKFARPGCSVLVELGDLTVRLETTGSATGRWATVDPQYTAGRLAGDRCESMDCMLPVAPTVVTKILQLAADPECGVSRVVPVVKSDPALAGRVIAYVNSARFGLRSPVTDLVAAATLIGYVNLRALTLGYALRSAWADRCPAFDYKEYWRRTTATSAAAHQLALSSNCVPPEDALTLGLLADIGRLALATCEPERYARVLAEVGSNTGELLLQAESHYLGRTHHEVTLELLLKWNLPQDFAVAAYHQEEESPIALVERAASLQRILHYAVHMSSVFTWPQQSPNRFVLAHVGKHAAQVIGNTHGIAGAFNGAIVEWHELGEMLDVPTSEVTPWPSASLEVG